tara:strand:- start:197 stop:685 length:489 start_codon:yes stop_codon:yes gene_type:complete
LAPEKNIATLVKHFRELGPEYKLTIVGEGPERKLIEQLAIGYQNIELIGPVEPDALSNLYTQHHVLALLSRSEVWGLVVNEAINHGLALLLSSTVGSSADLLKGNGMMLDHLSKDSLLETLQVIKSNLIEFRSQSTAIAEQSTVELQSKAFLTTILRLRHDR